MWNSVLKRYPTECLRVIMPRSSLRTELLNIYGNAALQITLQRYENVDSDDSPSPDASDSGYDSPLIISPPTPISPLSPFDSPASEFSSASDSTSAVNDQQYAHLFAILEASIDEIAHARVLDRPDEPPMRAPQIQLLDHFADHQPL